MDIGLGSVTVCGSDRARKAVNYELTLIDVKAEILTVMLKPEDLNQFNKSVWDNEDLLQQIINKSEDNELGKGMRWWVT